MSLHPVGPNRTSRGTLGIVVSFGIMFQKMITTVLAEQQHTLLLHLPPGKAKAVSLWCTEPFSICSIPCTLLGDSEIFSWLPLSPSIRGQWFIPTTHPSFPWVLDETWVNTVKSMPRNMQKQQGPAWGCWHHPCPPSTCWPAWLSLHLKQEPLGTTVRTHLEHSLCSRLWFCGQVS